MQIVDVMKSVAVVVGQDVRDLVIAPGTTASNVVRELGLPGDYRISRHGCGQFGQHEVIYDSVQHGDKLYASPPANVGGTAWFGAYPSL